MMLVNSATAQPFAGQKFELDKGERTSYAIGPRQSKRWFLRFMIV
jgi:hypothetical protein